MKSIRISLSRSHKIAERITREIDSLQGELSLLHASVTVNVEKDLDKVDVRLKKIDETHSALTKLYAALVITRHATGEANAKHNIQGLLWEKSILTRRFQALESLSQQCENLQRSGVSKETAPEYLGRLATAGSVNTVQVHVLTEDRIDEYKKLSKSLKRELDNVSDKINTINASTHVSLEFDEEVAELIGL